MLLSTVLKSPFSPGIFARRLKFYLKGPLCRALSKKWFFRSFLSIFNFPSSLKGDRNMAVVKPFRGYFYSSKFIEAPPRSLSRSTIWCNIRKRKIRLTEDPYNFAHLTLGKAEDDYQKAKQLLQSWIKEGVVEQDEAPSFYIDEQEFQLNSSSPAKKNRLCRSGAPGALG